MPGTLDLRQSFLSAPGLDEKGGVPVVGAGQARIQLDSPVEFTVGCGYIEESPEAGERQGIVGLGGVGVELDGFGGG